MRMIRYFVINKTTREPIYTHYKEAECRKHLEAMENKDQFTIGYKWMSI